MWGKIRKDRTTNLQPILDIYGKEGKKKISDWYKSRSGKKGLRQGESFKQKRRREEASIKSEGKKRKKTALTTQNMQNLPGKIKKEKMRMTSTSQVSPQVEGGERENLAKRGRFLITT